MPRIPSSLSHLALELPVASSLDRPRPIFPEYAVTLGPELLTPAPELLALGC